MSHISKNYIRETEAILFYLEQHNIPLHMRSRSSFFSLFVFFITFPVSLSKCVDGNEDD